MWASIAASLLSQNSEQDKQGAQNELLQEQQEREGILQKRANRQQMASSIGLQGMDVNKQAAFQRQQDFFNSVMSKYNVRGV